jgi:hypothetical protein
MLVLLGDRNHPSRHRLSTNPVNRDYIDDGGGCAYHRVCLQFCVLEGCRKNCPSRVAINNNLVSTHDLLLLVKGAREFSREYRESIVKVSRFSRASLANLSRFSRGTMIMTLKAPILVENTAS